MKTSGHSERKKRTYDDNCGTWASAVERAIPAGIRGEFLPCNVGIEVGFHDLFECAEEEEGRYIARAFLSVQFSGYSSPNDWGEFQRRVMELPEVLAVQAELEEVTGPLEKVIHWFI